jgi:hypothetical protein
MKEPWETLKEIDTHYGFRFTQPPRLSQTRPLARLMRETERSG